MLPSRRHAYALSRDPALLLRAVLGTAAVFILSAFWIGLTRPGQPPGPSYQENATSAIAGLLQSPNPDRTTLLRALREQAEARRHPGSGLAEDPDEEDPVPFPDLPAMLADSALPGDEPQAFFAWYEATRTGLVPPELIPQIAALAMPSAPSLPRTMAADLKRTARDYQGALAAYEAAGADPNAVEARRRALALAVNRDWPEVLSRLLAQPAYDQTAHALDDRLSETIARRQMDLPLLFRRTFAYLGSGFCQTDYLLLSLLTAAVWFISLHKACRLPRRLWWFSLAGLPLGVFSTVIALVLYSLQEGRQGLKDSTEAGSALLFQIASVGLREELSKLICFLPLALVLRRRGTPAQALLAASCVGLGFAFQENIGYYAQSGGSSVLGRYVTATFMHIGLTGLTGLALFKFLLYPKNFGPLFGGTFTGMVLLHGFYNFSQSGFDNPFSRELSSLTPFMIAGLAGFYFQTLRHEQDDAPQRLSAEAVFLLGTTIVMGILLNFHVWESDWQDALTAFMPAALSSLLFCWLFHHFLRNT